MPATSVGTERLAKAVVGILSAAESVILARLAVALTSPLDDFTGGWTLGKALALSALRTDVDRILTAHYGAADHELRKALYAADTLGRSRATTDLRQVGIRPVKAVGADLPRVVKLADDLAGRLTGTRVHVLRSVDDVFRRAVGKAIMPVVAGVSTRREASLQVVLDLAQQGLPGFKDSLGRMWGLDTYAEMATRAASARSAVGGHLDAFEQSGLDLVQVNAVARVCDVCYPWQGQILSISGLDNTYASVETALGAGLLHPGCRHNLAAYVDGLSARVRVPDRTASHEGYAAEQGQRARERVVRGYGRRVHAAQEVHAAYPSTESAAQLASARSSLRGSQTRLHEYIDANDLTRQAHREAPFGTR